MSVLAHVLLGLAAVGLACLVAYVARYVRRCWHDTDPYRIRAEALAAQAEADAYKAAVAALRPEDVEYLTRHGWPDGPQVETIELVGGPRDGHTMPDPGGRSWVSAPCLHPGTFDTVEARYFRSGEPHRFYFGGYDERVTPW